MKRIPAGTFAMGKSPGQRIEFDRPFWIGQSEITNEQFQCFDPSHDSRLEHGDYLQFSIEERGYPVNAPRQPVVRVSWNQAMDYCRWLSERTGETFTLPSESEWEYACRAGTDTPFWFGGAGAEFNAYANLADRSLQHIDTFAPWSLPSGAIYPWRPAVADVDDAYRVTAPVGTFRSNPWGLNDMHGNAAEWTRTACRENGGGSNSSNSSKKMIRGGSWYARPKRARSDSYAAYDAYLPVFDVGFRVVCTSAGDEITVNR